MHLLIYFSLWRNGPQANLLNREKPTRCAFLGGDTHSTPRHGVNVEIKVAACLPCVFPQPPLPVPGPHSVTFTSPKGPPSPLLHQARPGSSLGLRNKDPLSRKLLLTPPAPPPGCIRCSRSGSHHKVKKGKSKHRSPGECVQQRSVAHRAMRNDGGGDATP